MAREIQFPTCNEKLDSFMMNVVWKRDSSVRLYDKQSSALMWTIYYVSFMWIWLPDFFDNSHTTIGKKVYIKRESILLEDWGSIYRAIRHEFIHILQRDKYGFLYDFAYVFPQVLAVFSLFAILSIWFGDQWLYALVFLIFLFPIPAYWRMTFEMEGYTQTLLVEYETYGRISESSVRRIAKNFTGTMYFFMWPFGSWVRRRLEDIVDDIECGKIKTPHLHYSC